MSQSETVRLSICPMIVLLRTLDGLGYRVGKLLRELLFFIWEGGEAEKWSEDRPHSAKARASRPAPGSGRASFLAWVRSVTYDHATPIACLRPSLFNAADDPEEILCLLDRGVRGVVITREENQELEKAGLRSSMPPGASLLDLTARYRAVGIDFEPRDLRLLGG